MVQNTRRCPGCDVWIPLTNRRGIEAFEKHKREAHPDLVVRQKVYADKLAGDAPDELAVTFVGRTERGRTRAVMTPLEIEREDLTADDLEAAAAVFDRIVAERKTPVKRIERERLLTAEEAAEYAVVRAQVEVEFPPAPSASVEGKGPLHFHKSYDSSGQAMVLTHRHYPAKKHEHSDALVASGYTVSPKIADKWREVWS